MPDFFEVVHTQRAARSFLPDDVDDATVARILTAATHAPSAENSQPFVFVVVRDATIRAAIGALTARLWEGGAKALEEQRLSPAFLRDVDHGATGGVAGAPVLVVVCGDTRLTYPKAMDASVFPAVQNLLLAAHALGLGSTLTTLPVLGGDELATAAGPAARDRAGRRDPTGPPAPAAGPSTPATAARESPSQPLRDSVPAGLSAGRLPRPSDLTPTSGPGVG